MGESGGAEDGAAAVRRGWTGQARFSKAGCRFFPIHSPATSHRCKRSWTTQVRRGMGRGVSLRGWCAAAGLRITVPASRSARASTTQTQTQSGSLTPPPLSPSAPCPADKDNANPTVFVASAAHHTYDLREDDDEDEGDFAGGSRASSSSSSSGAGAANPSHRTAHAKRDPIDSLEVYGAWPMVGRDSSPEEPSPDGPSPLPSPLPPLSLQSSSGT